MIIQISKKKLRCGREHIITNPFLNAKPIADHQVMLLSTNPNMIKVTAIDITKF